MNAMCVPDARIRLINDRPVNPEGQYVLYWMLAARRLGWNFALQRAAELAQQLDRPLLIFEALNCDYPYASDRLHRFILQGMAEHSAQLQDGPAAYYPYVEPAPGAGKGLLLALSVQACAVVTDDHPAFFFPRLIAATGSHLPMRFEAVDNNGLLPMRAADQVFPTAYAFRRFLQKRLPEHLMDWPLAGPLTEISTQPVTLPSSIREHWPDATENLLSPAGVDLAQLPIDHAVPPVDLTGGSGAARERLTGFIDDRLHHYHAERNHPDADVTSGLSPYLHFGQIGTHEVFAALVAHEDWTPHELSHRTDGKRTGWWHMSSDTEAFLDQLITWRELGFNMCCHAPDRYMSYENLPDWALKTLAAHAGDPRPYCYTLEELQHAQTHDEIWNAAQRQLLQEGIIHNYLRMLWGKKILEWSPTPMAALKVMIELNDRYALDGRDPNSYAGIFWCLGRYDRAWGPTRPIFGSVRYMSSENTKRKVKMKKYLKKFK